MNKNIVTDKLQFSTSETKDGLKMSKSATVMTEILAEANRWHYENYRKASRIQIPLDKQIKKAIID